MFHRIFFSRVTTLASAAAVIVLSIASLIAGRANGQTVSYAAFDAAVKVLLAVLLLYGYYQHSLPVMQAGCSALMLGVLYDQAGYIFNTLLKEEPESFMLMGFWGSFYLGVELMLLILEAVIPVNYFLVHVLKKGGFLRIRLNQFTILILLFFLFFQLFINSRLHFDASVLVYAGIRHLCLVAIYMLIACTELILSLDSDEEAGK